METKNLVKANIRQSSLFFPHRQETHSAESSFVDIDIPDPQQQNTNLTVNVPSIKTHPGKRLHRSLAITNGLPDIAEERERVPSDINGAPTQDSSGQGLVDPSSGRGFDHFLHVKVKDRLGDSVRSFKSKLPGYVEMLTSAASYQSSKVSYWSRSSRPYSENVKPVNNNAEFIELLESRQDNYVELVDILARCNEGERPR
ncbi:uncharacterized protein [Macrobrachium rosenbergii]|uniref:uncharacterized protein n=1 Tax=Macrobrachium rosenbergii TaxID=79674 RepID=UPI0034D3E7F8